MADFQWTAPPKPKSQSLVDRAKAILQSTTAPESQIFNQYGALPSEGINAILGSLMRVVQSGIGGAKENPVGTAELALPPPLNLAAAAIRPEARKAAGNALYAVLHPNDPSIRAKAMEATGANKLLSKDPRFRGKAQNFAVNTGFDFATDPLNVAAPGIAGLGEMGLEGAGKLGTAALKSPNEIVRNTAKNTLTNVAEREGGFTPEEIAKSNSIQQRDITRARVQHTADQDLLHRNKAALRRGEIPDEVRQRLLGEPYMFGTPHMRAQAALLGYRPNLAQSEMTPLGVLNYNLKNEYDPHTGMLNHQDSYDDLLLGQTKKLKKPEAGFEEHQTTGKVPSKSLYDRIEKRLASGRNVVRSRMTQQSLQEKLGIGPEMAADMAKEEKLGGIKALQGISRAQVDSMITTGFPHMKNVGIAGFLSMGEAGMANAVRYFMLGVPEKLSQRLEEGGASHFGLRTPGKYSPANLVPRPIRQATTGTLDRWDQALRAARLQQVDKELPKADELVKLDRVNQDLGAYNLKPQYVKWLQSFGANFPQWHNYIVPTMVGRALLRNPGRVHRLTQAEQNANDTFNPGGKQRVTLGGPVDEAASAAADLARIGTLKYPSYFGGPSSLGPASYILHPPPHVTPKQRALEVLSGFVPFGPAILDATVNPFKSTLPPAARFATGVAGIYNQKRTTGSMARTAGQATTPAAPTEIWSVPGATQQPTAAPGGFQWQTPKP